jgi:hypothetical protein
MRFPRHAAIVAACLFFAACHRAGGDIAIAVAADAPGGRSVIRVSGLSSAELAAAPDASADTERWQALLRVSVADAPDDQPALAGRYAIAGSTLEFHPMFPLDPGRKYRVVVDRATLGTVAGSAPVAEVVALPAVAHAATTTVAHVYPTADALPENALRFYIEFSAPMSRSSGLDYVRLKDDKEQEVVDPFLPLDVDLWSHDYKRYTLFLDPGRVKTGILPNEQMGRALEAGRTYHLDISAEWRDGNGQPLAKPHRQSFKVTAAETRPIDPARWTIAAPAAGSRDPVAVTLDRPLDHGLLQRAVGISRAGEPPIAGEVSIAPGEREWRFTPAAAWIAGDYDVMILSLLEDVAGNRIGRSFEVDKFDRIDDKPEAIVRRPFRVK